MKRKLTLSSVVIAAVVGALVALNAVPGAATQGSNFSSAMLARGNDQSPGTLPLQQGTDIVFAQSTAQPGGFSGWHSHPGGAVVVVKQGEITIYTSTGSECNATTYHAGDAFIERAGEIVDAVNTGTTVTVIYVMYPRVAQGTPQRIDLPDPGTCPGL